MSSVLASMGGLYTSVVVKYTDNIMKGFSAAAAIVLSTVASVLLFGLQISEWEPFCAIGRGQVWSRAFRWSSSSTDLALLQPPPLPAAPYWSASPSTCTACRSRTPASWRCPGRTAGPHRSCWPCEMGTAAPCFTLPATLVLDWSKEAST